LIDTVFAQLDREILPGLVINQKLVSSDISLIIFGHEKQTLRVKLESNRVESDLLGRNVTSEVHFYLALELKRFLSVGGLGANVRLDLQVIGVWNQILGQTIVNLLV
jgi:hypothetical protein